MYLRKIKFIVSIFLLLNIGSAVVLADLSPSQMISISLESLDDYNEIKNRKVKLWKGKDIAKCVKKILEHLKQKDNEGAKAALDSLFKIFAKYAKKEYEKS